MQTPILLKTGVLHVPRLYVNDCCMFSDELSSILKKLSLEKYQPIFEEQEVLFFVLPVGFFSVSRSDTFRLTLISCDGLDWTFQHFSVACTCRWTWRRSWLWQMETWRSWALKQMDPDNRSWLLYQSSMLERLFYSYVVITNTASTAAHQIITDCKETIFQKSQVCCCNFVCRLYTKKETVATQMA